MQARKRSFASVGRRPNHRERVLLRLRIAAVQVSVLAYHIQNAELFTRRRFWNLRCSLVEGTGAEALQNALGTEQLGIASLVKFAFVRQLNDHSLDIVVATKMISNCQLVQCFSQSDRQDSLLELLQFSPSAS